MTRKRKKNVPNDILSTAIYMGLASLVRLASKRTSQKTRKYYFSIKNIWQKYQKQLERRITDFHPVEPNMRNQFLAIVWQSTRRFGNREFKRVYSWFEGTVGPLNALLNYAGARLRDLAMTRYPFPEPKYFQIRKYADGSKKVLSKEEAECLGPDDAVKTYWRGGYSRSGKSPLILLAHPTLPELDFVDMIRAHMIELCRQCFIYNVQRTEAHRYINLLIHRLRPFLDWIYTAGEYGRPYFNRYSDHELREIVQEIRALYGNRTGREKSVTKGLDSSDTSLLSINEFREKVEKLRDSTNSKKENEVFSEILNHIDEGNIEQRDVEKIIEQVLALSSREGTEWHRILLSDLHHPKSLKQVVFAGDAMLDEPSSILIVGELPVSRRKGQIDLVIFLRREVSSRAIWTPVMILEIKTKTSFDYNLYGLRTKNKNVKEYAPSLYAWKHTKTEDEWNDIFTSDPHPRTLNQLDAYEEEVLSEYKQVAPLDPTPPKSLWKGVVVLDTDQSPLEVFEGFQDLLGDIVTKITSDLLDISQTTAYSLDPSPTTKTLRVATILTPGEGPVELLNDACMPESLPIDDPFSERVSDDRLLTLYVPVASPISSGNTAAWISKNWHLFNHIHECSTSAKDTEIHWVDLMGDYPNVQLAKKRFGLDLLMSEGWTDRKKSAILDAIIDKVRFINLSTNIDQILAGNILGFDSLIDNFNLSLRKESLGYRIVVIDGWSEFKDMVPSSRQHIIHSLEKRLLNCLPTSNINIIWIDSGVQHTRMNKHYQRRCVSPLPHDSPRKMHVDEIIYNLPTSSRGFGRFLPKRDDERYIVQDVPASAPPWKTKIHVPHLFEYSRKFRGCQRRKPTLNEEEVYRENLRSMYGRGVTLSNIYSDTSRYSRRQVSELEEHALSLVPSTLRIRGEPTEDQELESDSDTLPEQLVTPTITTGHPSTLSSRLTYIPDASPPRPNKAKSEYVSSKGITRRWFYERVPSQDFSKDDELHRVTRPPTVIATIFSNIDSKRMRGLELRRLFYTVRFLSRKKNLSKNLSTCCRKISTICAKTLSTELDEQRLLYTLKQVRDIILEDSERLRLWETVRPIRQGLFDLLNSENQAALKAVFEQNPEVLQLYGNNLFLAILAVLDNEYNDTLLSYVVPLWQSVVEWELYQLGFKPRQEGVVSKYDFHSIYSHLNNRAKTLTTLNLPEIILSKQNAGQIIWTEREGIYSAWIIFQSEKGIVAGLIDNLNSQWLHPTWYRCITDLQVLKDTGIESLSSTERNTIVVTEFGEYKILWMQIDGEDGPVWRSLAMEYGASHEKGQSILWIRFIETYEVPTLCDQVLVPPVLSTDIGIYMDDFLKGTYSHEMVMVPVTCEVSINMKERVYELRFKDKSRETILDTLLFDSTAELVKTLRHPIRRGTPLRIKHGVRVMWDHRIDIDYHDTELKDGQKKHTISLSLLKPLVHRSRFFPDKFTVPKTCSELLSTEVGNPLTLRIQSEISAFRKMSVEFDGVPVGSSLRALETMRMNIFDIALLSECEQLIDASTNKCHQIEIDANDLFDLNFSRLSEYPRLQSAIASLDANDFDWTQHSWNINIDTRHPVQNEIIWYIKTKVSGRIWFNKTFTFVMDISLSIDEVISTFKEEVSLTVPLKHLTEFSESISTLNRTLRSRGWRKGKPRCRVDLTIRDGQYIAVVCRLEAHGESIEIANIPIDIAKDSSVLQDELESEWGPFSIYEIRNKNEFYKKVRSATLIEEEEEGFDEEEEYLRQIKEYESNPEKSYQLAYTYVKLVHCRPESDSSISDITKAIILFEECDHSVRGVVIWHLNALVTRCELLVKKGVDSIRKEEIKGWMREIQEMYDQLIQMSNIGEDYTEFRERILQLQVR